MRWSAAPMKRAAHVGASAFAVATYRNRDMTPGDPYRSESKRCEITPACCAAVRIRPIASILSTTEPTTTHARIQGVVTCARGCESVGVLERWPARAPRPRAGRAPSTNAAPAQRPDPTGPPTQSVAQLLKAAVQHCLPAEVLEAYATRDRASRGACVHQRLSFALPNTQRCATHLQLAASVVIVIGLANDASLYA